MTASPFSAYRSDAFFELGDAFYQTLLLSFPTEPTPLWINTDYLSAQIRHLPQHAYADISSYLLPQNTDIPALAMAYSGHQFGHWAGQLGDGRAALLAQISTEKGFLDLHLKGSGPTQFSRGGDGKAMLWSIFREALASEALHALNIPTTRAGAIWQTHEKIHRDGPAEAGLFLRCAPNHLRIGHFEHFFAADRPDLIQKLANYTIQYFEDGITSYEDWFLTICERSARLVAQWQAIGFCHGVLNTDNTAISGFTLDYGPYGFLETYEENHICNHSDETGRYAFQNQPLIMHWNLQALAYALQSLMPFETAQEILSSFPTIFQQYYHGFLAEKFGLSTAEKTDPDLYQEYFSLLKQTKRDYTQSFKYLEQALDAENSVADYQNFFDHHPHADAFLTRLKTRHTKETDAEEDPLLLMKTHNPYYILRNWLAEEAFLAFQKDQNMDKFTQLMAQMRTPYQKHPTQHDYYFQTTPEKYQKQTVSCLS